MNFDLSKYFNETSFEIFLKILIILAVGLAIIYSLGYLIQKVIPSGWSSQRKMIIKRIILYSGFIILFFILVSELKINLAPVFGAAGIIGIIVGIASQNSIGNIVSGFFLVSEKSFEIGDLVRMGEITGIVYNIDLLSIKIRTFDNVLIRIPNQTVISTELTNITRFPLRRMDFHVTIAYKEDLAKAQNILLEVARKNPLCLDEPEPLILFQKFGSSGMEILFGIWFEKADYVEVKNSGFMEIKQAFDAAGIEIPFPHVTFYTGEKTRPFPVILSEGSPDR